MHDPEEPGEARRDEAHPPEAVPGTRRTADAGDGGPTHHERNVALLERLDAFLDERAEDGRQAMEAVVDWLAQTGGLDEEIHRSVESLGAIFQKWSFEIMFLLRIRGTIRFNELKQELTSVGQQGIADKVRDLAGVGSRTLSQRLKDLEGQGLIRREVYPEVPVRVEYSLTSKGMRFGDLIMPVIAHLRIWDAQHRRD